MEGSWQRQGESLPAEPPLHIFEELHASMLALLADFEQQLVSQRERLAVELEATQATKLTLLEQREAFFRKLQVGVTTIDSLADAQVADDTVPLERLACLPFSAAHSVAESCMIAPDSSHDALQQQELPRLLGLENASMPSQPSKTGRRVPLSKVRPPVLQIPQHGVVQPKGLHVTCHEYSDDAQVSVVNADRGVPAAPGGGQDVIADNALDGGVLAGESGDGADSSSSTDDGANRSAGSHCSVTAASHRTGARESHASTGKQRFSMVSIESLASGKQIDQYFPDLQKLQQSKSILRQLQHHVESSLDATIGQQLRVGDMLVQDGVLQRLVLNPSSRCRFGWDITGIILIGYDAMIIPMQVFDLPETSFSLCVNWATTCFWTCDVPVSFLTGYHTKGFLEMRPVMIAKRYLRTWLVADLAVVFMDWSFIAVGLGDAAGVLRFGKSTRALRILRALRLLRLMKVIDLMAKISDGLNSELLLMVMNIWKLVVSVVILNHYIACLWFLITTIDSHEVENWARVHGVDTATVDTQYGVALHWSLTQFMPASMEVNPTNVRERYFAIFILIFGLVTFSSFVSSITTVMAQLRNISSDRISAEANLRQYLNENRVSVDLGIRIRQFFRENYEARRRRVHEVDVVFFESLPESLKVELHKEVYMPVITKHPVFYHYYAVDAAGIWLICHLTMSQQSYVATQTIFLEGEPAREMMFVVTGSLKYHLSWQALPRDIQAGAWLCEAALWFNNSETRGRVEAFVTSEIFSINARKFRSVTRERGRPFWYLRRYAKYFMQYVSEAKDDAVHATDICDEVLITQEMADKVFSATYPSSSENSTASPAPRTPRTPLSSRSLPSSSMRTPPRRFVAANTQTFA